MGKIKYVSNFDRIREKKKRTINFQKFIPCICRPFMRKIGQNSIRAADLSGS